MNDYRFYQITIGCDKSILERSYRVIATNPAAAIVIAKEIALKDQWPFFSILAAVSIVLTDNRTKN